MDNSDVTVVTLLLLVDQNTVCCFWFGPDPHALPAVTQTHASYTMHTHRYAYTYAYTNVNTHFRWMDGKRSLNVINLLLVDVYILIGDRKKMVKQMFLYKSARFGEG